MCDPEINDKQAKIGLRKNMVDYDPCCGKTATQLLVEYCAQGMIKEHVTMYPVVDSQATEPSLAVSQEAGIVPAPYNP